MNWFWLKISAVGVLLILTGCNDLISEEGDPREKDRLILIEEGISFTVKETHDQSDKVNAPVEPYVQLEIITKDIFNCLGYRIVSDLSRNQSNIHVDIEGVKEPGGLCPAALGPAANAFALDLSPGEYELIFEYNGTTYPFQLTVSDSSLQVSNETSSFVTSDIETFWRYPEQSFAFLCQSTSDTRWMCEDYEQILNDSLEVSSFTFPDHGTKPYPTTDDHYNITTYYHYSEEPVFLKAGQMLEAYADSVVSQEEGAYLSVINWKNQGFRSWTDVGE